RRGGGGGRDRGEATPKGGGGAGVGVGAGKAEPVAAADRLDPMEEASETRVLDDVPEVTGGLHVDADRGVEQGLGLAEVVVGPEILRGIVAGERAEAMEFWVVGVEEPDQFVRLARRLAEYLGDDRAPIGPAEHGTAAP